MAIRIEGRAGRVEGGGQEGPRVSRDREDDPGDLVDLQKARKLLDDARPKVLQMPSFFVDQSPQAAYIGGATTLEIYPGELGRIEGCDVKFEVVKGANGKESLRLTEHSKEMLNELHQVLMDNPKYTKIRIEGHTIGSGNLQHDISESVTMARLVVDHLAGIEIKKDGTIIKIDPARLEAEGYGPMEPINEENPKGPENRRIKVVILKMSSYP